MFERNNLFRNTPHMTVNKTNQPNSQSNSDNKTETEHYDQNTTSYWGVNKLTNQGNNNQNKHINIKHQHQQQNKN